ncbi:MAG: RluA family pseudouridine synthase [Patescibacteria group bacterium]|nr:RluA family pseudouridine synthase [Patescibacteria group bacterium]
MDITQPTVLYEDDAIILIDKPSGLPVHKAVGKEEPTLADWLIIRFPELAEVGEPQRLGGVTVPRPGIVHRIDRETSGILLLARTQQAFVRLKKQFQRREVHKTYRAFVYGALKEERGSIERPIGRARGSGSRRSVSRPHGMLREALTLFRTILHSAPGASEPSSYLEVFPKTGRTHQIRVHLASIGNPVICDELYAPNRPAVLNFSRLALHALSLSFVHPESGKQVTFEAPLPYDFLHAEKLLREEAE